MWPRVKWLVLWTVWACRVSRHATPPLRLAGGELLRGQLSHDGTHTQYFGIPYATAHATNRFQAPGPEPSWDGVLDAIHEHIRCPQVYAHSVVVGREDCLTLNVYVPLRAPAAEAPLPVMVFIHGGAFKEGSGSRLLYGPDYLISKGVILVTINYRLGVLGFLCLNIKEAPGNAGMKDQVAALKWIKRNIRAFGGDPDNVTIFGESAGAVSVSYHILSPMSKGLFHKAILQSGSSLAPWAYQSNATVLASHLATSIGHSTLDPHELYDKLMIKSVSELVTAAVPQNDGRVVLAQPLYVPCTERTFDGVEPFITEVPFDILSKGEYNKVPVVVGANIEEGYFFVAMEDATTLENTDFAISLPSDLDFPTERERKQVARKVEKMYMGEDKVCAETFPKLSKYYGEVFFNYPTAAETQLLIQTNDKPVYSYLMSYDGWRNFPKLISGLRYWFAPGATHADELFYLFSLFPVPSLFEKTMIDKMTTMWSDFAIYGEPTPSAREAAPASGRWVPAAEGGRPPRSLLIDAELSAAPLYYSDTLQFWREIYAKYRKKY